MPCRCDGFDEPQVSEKVLKAVKKELDRVTQLLCYVCGTMQPDCASFESPDFGVGNNACGITIREHVPKELKEWFREHNAADLARVRKAMAAAAKEYLPEYPAAVQEPYTSDALSKAFIDKALKVHPVSGWHQRWFKALAKEALVAAEKQEERKRNMGAVARRALAKLTPKERAALGL